jgi:hypothetical protein
MLEPLDRATNSHLVRLMAVEDIELLDDVLIAADDCIIRLYGAGEKEEGTGFSPNLNYFQPWLDLSWDEIKLTPGEYRYIFNVFKNWRYTEEGGS